MTQQASENPCPFCRIPIDGSESILGQTDHCYVIGLREPNVEGMMIIPVRHVESPFDLTREEWIDHQELAKEARRLLSGKEPEGFNVGWNVGRVGGQSVLHAHLHVVARFANEPFAGKGIRHWIKSDENARPQ